MKHLKIGLLFFTLVCMMGCAINNHKTHSVSRAFYYWKSVFKLSEAEKDILQILQVKKIYLKFFDVDWQTQQNQPRPIAQVRIQDSSLRGNHFEIIPTVFITNECMSFLPVDSVEALALNIYSLINAMANNNQLANIAEIQIDCDWTESTKDKYFGLLAHLQKLDPTHVYSATIRFYQIKYWEKAGIPPVKKGLLMCYNMGNLKSEGTKNSILDLSEMQGYIEYLQEYPLMLDVGLPLFEWLVLFREGQYKGLIKDLDVASLKGFATQKEMQYKVQKDTSFAGYTFKKNDVLRLEKSEAATVIAAGKMIDKKLSHDSITLSLYHLDQTILNKYKQHELENIFNSLR